MRPSGEYREASARLLSVLATHWGDDKGFDATSIACRILDIDQGLVDKPSNELFAALEFLGVRKKQTGVTPGYLTQASHSRIRKWFDRVEGDYIEGMVLERDEYGWCFVKQVPQFCLVH